MCFRPALASSSAASRCETDTRAGALRHSLAWSRSICLMAYCSAFRATPRAFLGVALASMLCARNFSANVSRQCLQVGLAWVEPHAVRINSLDGQVNV